MVRCWLCRSNDASVMQPPPIDHTPNTTAMMLPRSDDDDADDTSNCDDGPLDALTRNDPRITAVSNTDYTMFGSSNNNDDDDDHSLALGQALMTPTINDVVTTLHLHLRRLTFDHHHHNKHNSYDDPLLTWIATSPSLTHVTLTGTARDYLTSRSEVAVVDRVVAALVQSTSVSTVILQAVAMPATAYAALLLGSNANGTTTAVNERSVVLELCSVRPCSNNNTNTGSNQSSSRSSVVPLVCDGCSSSSRCKASLGDCSKQRCGQKQRVQQRNSVTNLTLKVADVSDSLQVSMAIELAGATLTNLTIINTERRFDTSVAIVEELACLPANLVHLELGYLQLRARSLSLLAKGIAMASEVRSLTIRGCSFLEDSSVAVFCEMVHTHVSLNALAFCGAVRFGRRTISNHKRCIGKVVLRILASCPHIAELDVLEAKGSLAHGDLSAILYQQSTLPCFGLKTLRTSIGDAEELKAFVECLPNLESITTLELNITSRKAMDKSLLLSAFRSNTSLQEVLLRDMNTVLDKDDLVVIEFFTLRNRLVPRLLATRQKDVPLSLLPALFEQIQKTEMGPSMLLLALNHYGDALGVID